MLRLVRAHASYVWRTCGIGIMAALCATQPLSATVRKAETGSAYRRAVIHIQDEIGSGHLKAARAALKDAFQRYPKKGGLENLLGIVEIQQGHTEAARRAFSKAIEESPGLTGAYLNLGRILMASAASDSEVRQKTAHLYEEVLRREPANEDANFEYAIVLMWQGRYRASLLHLGKLPARAHGNIRVEALRCADEAGLGKMAAANRAAERMKANANLREEDVVLAVPALRAAHRADLIAALLTAANGRSPLSMKGLRLLGLAQEAGGKLTEARATLTRVYDRDRSSAVPLVDLTRIALAQKKYEDALGYLAHARALRPHDASLAYEFGLVCVKLGLLDETIKAMGDAVKLAPDNAGYNLSMGLISSFGFTPETAIPYLKKYHAMRPKDPEGVLALGTGYFRAEKLREAAVWLRQAEKTPRTAGRAHYYLGRILFQHGQYQQAVAQLEESAKVQGNRADVYVELGKSYIHLKEYALAEKVLDRAIQLDPKSFNANLALLRAYSLTRDPRRSAQRKRFLAVHKEKEKEYVDALRTVSERPLWKIKHAPLSTGADGRGASTGQR